MLALDEAVVAAARVYRREWLRITLRALLVYIPGAALVLIARQLGGELLSALVTVVVFFAGVFWLQSIEVSEAAAARQHGEREPFQQAFRRLRPKAVVLMRGVGLLLLRVLVPSIAFSVLLVFVVGHTRSCQVAGFFEVCRANMAVVWSMLILFWLAIGSVYVRWSVWVPAVVLEDRGARSALRRSVQLTRGNRTRLFAWLATVGVISAVVLWFAQLILRSMIHNAAVEEFFRSMVADTLTAPLFVLLWTETFFRLREMQPADASEA